MVVILEHLPAPPPQPVASARDANQQTLHPARQAGRSLGLGDQVQMIRLHGEMDQPEAAPIRTGSERAEEGCKLRRTTQARQIIAQSNGHQDGEPRAERGSRRVRHSPASRLALAPGTLALSTVHGEGQTRVRAISFHASMDG